MAINCYPGKVPEKIKKQGGPKMEPIWVIVICSVIFVLLAVSSVMSGKVKKEAVQAFEALKRAAEEELGGDPRFSIRDEPDIYCTDIHFLHRNDPYFCVMRENRIDRALEVSIHRRMEGITIVEPGRGEKLRKGPDALKHATDDVRDAIRGIIKRMTA
jgi:hypothetical protein